MQHTTRRWWKEGVIYHIYPQSFYDSNGDGIGDIRGIHEKIDYILDLGVDAVWLGPVYSSPQHDNGYDVADYRDIDPRYGTLEDWKALAEALHQRGVRILGDLLVNHSSHKHAWFRDALTSKNSPHHDYYLWREGTKEHPPNDWQNFFGGSMWEWNEASREYYLHMFLKEQPDLNWENPRVRKEMSDVVAFWKDAGIDGFRIDVANGISKDMDVFYGKKNPSDPTNHNASIFFNGPNLQRYLQELCRRARSYGGEDFLMLGETPDVSAEMAEHLVGYKNDALNLLYSFELTMKGCTEEQGKWRARKPQVGDIRHYYAEWTKALYKKAWHVNYFNNHDLPRVVSRFGNDENYRSEAAKALLTISLFAYGTPVVYQGEELGMTNYPFTSFDEVRDVESLNFIAAQQKQGVSKDTILNYIRKSGRDNSRTPMQWNDSLHAGFTSGTPWIPVHPNYSDLNAAAQQNSATSVFTYAKQLMAYRKEHRSMLYAPMEVLQPENATQERVFAFSRASEDGTYIVLANLSDHAAPSLSAVDTARTNLVFGNYPDSPSRSQRADLRPWECRVLLLL